MLIRGFWGRLDMRSVIMKRYSVALGEAWGV